MKNIISVILMFLRKKNDDTGKTLPRKDFIETEKRPEGLFLLQKNRRTEK